MNSKNLAKTIENKIFEMEKLCQGNLQLNFQSLNLSFIEPVSDQIKDYALIKDNDEFQDVLTYLKNLKEQSADVTAQYNNNFILKELSTIKQMISSYDL